MLAETVVLIPTHLTCIHESSQWWANTHLVQARDQAPSRVSGVFSIWYWSLQRAVLICISSYPIKVKCSWGNADIQSTSTVHRENTSGALHVMFPSERLHITFKCVSLLLRHHTLASRGFTACGMSPVGDVSIQTAAVLCVFAGQFGKVWTISGIIWARWSI